MVPRLIRLKLINIKVNIRGLTVRQFFVMTKNTIDADCADATATQRKPGCRPGCPSGRQGADAREHLLDIALGLFAREGIGETTLGAIAREAGVTPAMVHYYFKTTSRRATICSTC